MISRLFFIFGVALTFASTSLAIETANCPETLSISIQSIRALDDDELMYDPWALGGEEEHVRLIRDGVAHLYTKVLKSTKLRLFKRARGMCSYQFENADNNLSEKTESHTRIHTTPSGRDVVRVAIPVTDNDIVWIYLALEKYSPAGIHTKSVKSAKILGFFDVTAPRITVGYANRMSLK